jgi:hypothetical protein
MANLSAPQIADVTTVQSKIAAAKSALNALAAQAGQLREAMAGIGTQEAMRAANACMSLQGVAIQLRGALIQEHAAASNALLDYDESNGGVIIQGGGGGR